MQAIPTIYFPGLCAEAISFYRDVLYADVLFKQGDYQRAKDFYIALRKQMPDKKAELAKKIARCNEKLKKPEHDGIAN